MEQSNGRYEPLYPEEQGYFEKVGVIENVK